jgi:transcriptional regulator with XRE-family HTH domain
MKSFGDNIKKLRTNKGLSQEAFAKEIGIHVTNLSKYERNISNPSFEIAQKMAVTLEVSLDTLAYGNDKASNTIQDNELLTLFNKSQKLSDNQKSTVKDLLKAFLFKENIQQQLAS